MNDQQPQMMINQAPIMNQPPLPPQQVMSQQPVQSQLLMMNRGYNNISNKQWPPLQQNPSKVGNFGSTKPRTNNTNNNNWKGKKITDKRNKQMGMSVGQGSTQGYNPPTLHELQSQNRQKTRKFYPNKKKFNNNNNNRFAPYAPRNTTSFIIRAKKSGGIASLVSPCPVTPAVLPTPIFSPSREVLGDMAKEEWGVDGYGSMKGLIRLRSGNENEHEDEDDEEANGSSESDVEEHVEVERRLDHDLSRFEMIYPNYNGGVGGDYNNVLENRVDDQDSHIAQLEEENLTLKERLVLDGEGVG
ncbi:PRLI-interacting factor A [Melia azedarach]|uniref:PRLI-interacting factor A n=1 Tax=Melia azedarach TaxID=155640 RepID=A0ACC1YKX7_MELAZ|nr:PRLI-interacting factor A [Melia azedarach]